MQCSRRGKPKHLHQVEFMAECIATVWRKQEGKRTDRQENRKNKYMKRDLHHASWVFSLLVFWYFCINFNVFLCDLGRFWGPGVHPGRGRHPDPKKHRKRTFSQPCLEGFWKQFGTFSEVVFVCVSRKCLFRLRGDLWAPKATERVPKWSPK